MNGDDRTNSRIRVGRLAAAATLFRGYSSTKQQLAAAVVCLITVSSAYAFSPSEIRRRVTPCSRLASERIVHHSSNLFSTNDEDASYSEDESEDIVMQQLRRHAQSGPIDPVKEYDKMTKDNQNEALNVTDSDSGSVNGSDDYSSLVNSTFYRSLLASYIDPDIDLDYSHDEYYVDQQFTELLSREGEELNKFGPGIATMPLDPTSEEAKAEQNLEQKEWALQQVVKQMKSNGSEKWDREKIDEGQRLKAEIDRIHIDDCGAVLLANLAFYEAFSARDADWMNDVWWNSQSIVCVHPSHHPLVGSKAVLGSFKRIFDQEMLGRESRGGGTRTAKNVFMSPANIRALSVRGTTASLVCDEEIYDKEESGRFVINSLLATNVFRKIGGKWKMVHRHASWHPETVAADAGRKAKPGFIPVKTERDIFNENLTQKRTFNDDLEKKRMRIKKLKGEGTSVRPANMQPAPASLDGLNANNVVGIPEEPVKPKRKKKSSSEDDLLRMLGISSDDDDDDDDDDDTDSSSKQKGISLSDLLVSGKDSETTTTGSGTPEDPFVTRRIIRIGPEQVNQLAANGGLVGADNVKEDTEDDEDDNVVIDLRDKSESERKSILSKIFPDQVDELMKTIKSSEKEDKPLKSAAPGPESAPIIHPKETKQSLTQKCIEAIRKLSDQGQLSSKQKRVLLTDIIAASARGETSMVEVAYGLLLSDDSEPGMEDFTEQCRVFATASMEGNEFGPE